MFGYKYTIQKRNDRVTYPKTKANVTSLLVFAKYGFDISFYYVWI